ncbi:hypothetical protein H9Q09_01170 [Aurantimonas sp. DM33-3]|uniref:hypothetical protein n=1 Tax=Aurantimonas sp. DM33-3 TaxID=2766955 RepID=UPI0016523C84|nr:hypothetical protein [Aurantimonas sp. DM33-3]MBC6714796.1 hypothetical protein [Aurantimonas sp. DM33-3]
MTKTIDFDDAEIVEPGDLSAISQAAREGDENIVGGAIGYPSHWADFTVSTPSSSTVRINQGRYFVDSLVYDLDAPEDIDMQVHLPLVVGDERYVAILARGVERTDTADRFVETDVETGDTILTPLPKTNVRTVEFVVQQGLGSPTPLKPVVAANNCCVCYIRLAANGIIAVESSNEHRVKTLYEVEGRVAVLEGQMAIAYQRTSEIETDLANLQGRLRDIPRPELIRQIQTDVAVTRRRLNLPDAARGYFYDPGLVKDQWGVDDALWLARVDEGVRHAFASERDDRLEVQNPAQTDIRIYDDILMPAWTEKVRLEVDGEGGTKNISQQVHTVTTAVERQVSRSSVSYGPTVAMCENVQEWGAVGQVRSGQTFQANGETFENLGAIDASYDASTVDLSQFSAANSHDWNFSDVVVHNSQVENQNGHQIYAARSVQVSSWTETYWDYVTETFGINGSVYAQTWLSTQPMIMTSIELKFDRVDTDGNVTVMLCEVSNTGSPIFDRVIAKSTLEPASIAAGWVKFPFKPRYLAPGRRYAWVTVTTGNYSLKTVTGAQYAQGTLFWSTDEAWFQGAPEEDFCFRVNAAEFSTTRAVVLLNPLTLENGMTEIKLLYESWAPEGTSMMWEVKPTGSDNWEPLRPETDEHPNPLRGLPALCGLRLTMLGTSGLAPGIVLNSKARGMARRPRSDCRAVTKELAFGYSTTAIQVEIVVDQFNELYHTAVPKIIVGGTTYDADAITERRDLAKSTRRTILADFTVPSTPTARLQYEANTTTVQAISFVENISLYAL